MFILAVGLAACSGSGNLGAPDTGGGRADTRDAWCSNHFHGSLAKMAKDLSDPSESVSTALDEINGQIQTFSQDETSADSNVSHYSSAIVAGLQDLHTWLMQTNNLADTLANHYVGFTSAISAVPSNFCP